MNIGGPLCEPDVSPKSLILRLSEGQESGFWNSPVASSTVKTSDLNVCKNRQDPLGRTSLGQWPSLSFFVEVRIS